MTALGQSTVNQSECDNSEQAEGRSKDSKCVFPLLQREGTEQRVPPALVLPFQSVYFKSDTNDFTLFSSTQNVGRRK